jgi:putative protease
LIPIPELLAPAGSLEALEVAVKNGADAVYFGLDRFSARSAAKNLTLEQLPAAIRFLHEHSARGYLALNTLLRNDELPRASTWPVKPPQPVSMRSLSRIQA